MSTVDEPAAENSTSGQGATTGKARPRGTVESRGTVEQLNLGLALSQNTKLRDQVALLQTGAAQLRAEVEEQTKRAEAAEKDAARIRESQARIAAGHKYLVQQLEREHDDRLANMREECRRAIAKANADHVEEVDRLVAQHATRMEQVAMEQLALGALVSRGVADPTTIPAGFPGRPAVAADAGEQVKAIGGLIAAAVATVRAQMDRRKTRPLTDRDLQIMRLAASGMGSQAIADHLSAVT